MEIDGFWLLVEQSRGSDAERAQALTDSLTSLGKDEIVDFENHLNRSVSQLMSFDHLAAHFMIQSYTSDDTFRDFQAWLVMQGRERFENAQKNVSSIADWLDRDSVEDIDGSVYVTLASSAYELAGGDEDDFYDQVEFPDDVDFEMDWPESPEGFETRWPTLYRKFWNAERIRELHAG